MYTEHKGESLEVSKAVEGVGIQVFPVKNPENCLEVSCNSREGGDSSLPCCCQLEHGVHTGRSTVDPWLALM